MEIYEQVEVHDCPDCGGASLLEEEKGRGFSVSCLDCGAHTIMVPFKGEEDKLLAARKAAELWNCGKAISSSPGE